MAENTIEFSISFRSVVEYILTLLQLEAHGEVTIRLKGPKGIVKLDFGETSIKDEHIQRKIRQNLKILGRKSIDFGLIQ